MQPENYKPKTTIIPANPDLFLNGLPVVAWVIEDGKVAKAITAPERINHAPLRSVTTEADAVRVNEILADGVARTWAVLESHGLHEGRLSIIPLWEVVDRALTARGVDE